MSFHYVIDGYNLLYALPDVPRGTLQEKREALLQCLKEKRPHGNNPVTVVFDSREGSGSRYRQYEINMVFTAGETADAWIGAHVRQAAQPRRVVVVSNDQGIRLDIKGTGARFLSASDFWNTPKRVVSHVSQPSREEDEAITHELEGQWLD